MISLRVSCRPLWVGMPSPYHRDGCCPLVPEPRTSPLAFTCRRQAVGMAAGELGMDASGREDSTKGLTRPPRVGEP